MIAGGAHGMLAIAFEFSLEYYQYYNANLWAQNTRTQTPCHGRHSP